MIQKRYEHDNLQERMNGFVFDIEYSTDAVKAIATGDEHVNVNDFLSKNKNEFSHYFRIL
jgi:hypothetical protein